MQSNCLPNFVKKTLFFGRIRVGITRKFCLSTCATFSSRFYLIHWALCDRILQAAKQGARRHICSERQQEVEVDATSEASDVFSCPRCKAPFTYLLRDRAEGNVPLVLQQCSHNMCLACVQASISEAEHPVINCRSIDHSIGRLIGWLVDQLIEWLSGRVFDCSNDWLICPFF